MAGAGAAPVSGRAAALAVMAVFLAQAVAVSLLRSGTSYDGAEQLLYTQYLDWGYGRSQPPLFTWLLWALHQVLGVTQLAENLLKFGLLGLGFVAVGAVSRRLGYSGRVAVVTILSVFLLVEIGWESQRNYTHTVLLFALSGALALVYLDLLRQVTAARFALLGAIFGLILLSKYNGALLVLALVAADLATPGARRFARRQSLWFWLVAAAVVAPHFLWAQANREAVLALTGGFVARGPEDAWARALLGLGQYLMATLGLWLLPALVAGGVALAAWRRPAALPMTAEARLFLRWAIILWGLGLLVVLLSGATVVRMRWLAPLTVPLLPVLVGEALRRVPRAVPVVGAIGLLLGAVSIGGQWYESTRLNARSDYDYAGLNAGLAAAGLPRDLVFSDYPVFANLRLYAPRAMAAPVMPRPEGVIGETATLLWRGSGDNGAVPLEAFIRGLGLCPEPGAAVTVLTLPRRHDPAVQGVSALPLSRGACDRP